VANYYSKCAVPLIDSASRVIHLHSSVINYLSHFGLSIINRYYRTGEILFIRAECENNIRAARFALITRVIRRYRMRVRPSVIRLIEQP
jgi:hypothetical protein